MHIHTITSFEEANKIAGQWNDLLTCCSASHVPFLRFEYLKAWWEILGGGEWDQAELFIVTATDEYNELIGIAPLFRTQNRAGEQALMLLGSIEISDYLDFIVRTTELEPFLIALLQFLSNKKEPGYQLLDLYNLPDTSPTLSALHSAAKKTGWSYNQEILQACPQIPLPGDWESYLLQIDKKQRHEIRRKMRRAEEAESQVRWYIATEAETLDREVEDFLGLMAQDPEKARFLTEAMRAQMQSIAHAAFEEGWLQLAFLTIDDIKAAGYFNFDYAGHIWVYNSGLDFSFRELSPGWVLLGYLLQWANDHQRSAFDFMRGSEDYKYRFGGIDRFVVRARLTKNQ